MEKLTIGKLSKQIGYPVTKLVLFLLHQVCHLSNINLKIINKQSLIEELRILVLAKNQENTLFSQS